MNMNYKAGDLVVIIDTQDGVKDMCDMIGKTVTISKTERTYCSIEEDGGKYYWLYKWLKPIDELVDFVVNDSDWNSLMGD